MAAKKKAAGRAKSKVKAKAKVKAKSKVKAKAKPAKSKKVAAKARKTPAVSSSKPLTKSETYAYLAETSGLTRKQVSGLFSDLADLIGKSVGRRGPGTYTVPGLMKIRVVRKPATKARPGINPFTGEKTIFKAKPARNVVKIQALKALKDMVK